MLRAAVSNAKSKSSLLKSAVSSWSRFTSFSLNYFLITLSGVVNRLWMTELLLVGTWTLRSAIWRMSVLIIVLKWPLQIRSPAGKILPTLVKLEVEE